MWRHTHISSYFIVPNTSRDARGREAKSAADRPRKGPFSTAPPAVDLRPPVRLEAGCRRWCPSNGPSNRGNDADFIAAAAAAAAPAAADALRSSVDIAELLPTPISLSRWPSPFSCVELSWDLSSTPILLSSSCGLVLLERSGKCTVASDRADRAMASITSTKCKACAPVKRR